MCGDKVDLTQKRKCDGGIEEASPSKTHGPTQTYKLDDTTSEASSNRTSAMSTRNCTRENGTLECVKSQQDENHSWLFVVVVLLCCCIVTVYLPECFVVNTRELRQRCLVLILICLRACPHAQGVGVLLSLLPASLFEHLSMGQTCNPPTQRTTLSVLSVLSCPLWPCSHRMCVIAKETGLSPLARTCSRTWIFSKAPPHLGAL